MGSVVAGTNVEEARNIIETSGFALTMASGFDDAARLACSKLT